MRPKLTRRNRLSFKEAIIRRVAQRHIQSPPSPRFINMLSEAARDDAHIPKLMYFTDVEFPVVQ